MLIYLPSGRRELNFGWVVVVVGRWQPTLM